MEGIAGVHDVGPPPAVLVGEEASLHDLDVRQCGGTNLGLQPVQHHRRHVDCDDPSAC